MWGSHCFITGSELAFGGTSKLYFLKTRRPASSFPKHNPRSSTSPTQNKPQTNPRAPNRKNPNQTPKPTELDPPERSTAKPRRTLATPWWTCWPNAAMPRRSARWTRSGCLDRYLDRQKEAERLKNLHFSPKNQRFRRPQLLLLSIPRRWSFIPSSPGGH